MHEGQEDDPVEPRCEYCQQPSDELTTVIDADPGVGYLDSLDVCPACIEKYGRR